MQWLRLLTLIPADGVPGNSCSFLIVSLSKSLSLCFMCSDQHVKYWMPCGFPSTSSLLLNYHVKQYTHTPKKHQLFTFSTILVLREWHASGCFQPQPDILSHLVQSSANLPSQSRFLRPVLIGCCSSFAEMK